MENRLDWLLGEKMKLRRLATLLFLCTFASPVFASAIPVWPFVVGLGLPVLVALVCAYLGWQKKIWLGGLVGLILGGFFGFIFSMGLLAIFL